MARLSIGKALLYARTLRHLRWRQWVYRPIRGIQRFVPPRIGPPAGIDTENALAMRLAVAGFVSLASEVDLARSEGICAGEFDFLNHSERMETVDWRKTYSNKLWTYNLHYFEYARLLAASYERTADPEFARCFEALAMEWVAGTTEGKDIGWEPYPLAIRVVNWAYAILIFGDAIPETSRHLLTRSLFTQLAFLEKRLEWHLLGNHLLKNMFALFVGGLLFGGESARRWRGIALRSLDREVKEQILSDGVHFERAPMYHAIALTDLLEIVALGRACGVRQVEEYVGPVTRMADAYSALSRADGTLHLFNDSANGIAPTRRYISSLAVSVLGRAGQDHVGKFALPYGGFFGYHDADRGERLVLDCGNPSPSYQPAHSHCGILGFELDFAGRPVVVDSGVSGYDGDPLRAYVRSTKAHNTVSIGGRNQSEIWGTFRMARRARVIKAELADDGLFQFRGGCSPYHDSTARHWREVRRDGVDWVITDDVDGASSSSIESYLHFHPSFQLVANENAIVLESGRLRVTVEPFGTRSFTVLAPDSAGEGSWFCPEFGKRIRNTAIRFAIEEGDRRHFGYRIRLHQAGT